MIWIKLLFVVLSISIVIAEVSPEAFKQDVEQGHSNRVDSLLEKQPKLLQSRFEDQNTALHIAIAAGDKEMVLVLLDHDADVNAQNNNGDTPIHVAIINDYPDLVRIILAYNPDLTLTNDTGSPLMTAASLERRDILNSLKQYRIAQSRTEL